MDQIIEPIVTNGQALKVTQYYVTIGSMNEENIEFSKRLNLVADQHQLPPKGSGRQVEMARIFGVSQKGARKWLEGESMPKTARINEIANYFGVNSEWLLSGRGQRLAGFNIQEQPATYNITNPCSTRLPLVPEDLGEICKNNAVNFAVDTSVEWIDTAAKVSAKAFAIRVTTDSMINPYGSPSIPAGAIVIIDPEIAADDGKIVLASLKEGDKTILKKLAIDGPNKYLKSLNPDYKPIIIDENCTIIGVAKRIEIDL
ncbi:MAG TPA: S24 family peptidase [Cellvibrio sp.]|nr:S24 family peptidase [Cellvibrio sp.]